MSAFTMKTINALICSANKKMKSKAWTLHHKTTFISLQNHLGNAELYFDQLY